jgi:hypothetical protein
MRQFLILVLTLFISNNLFGQHSKPDTLVAMFCDEQIKLDGKLDEPCWQKAVAIENFTQREQHEG